MIEFYIPIDHFIFGEKTYLSQDESAAQNVLHVQNTNGFVANEHIIIGRMGNEYVEIKKISAVNASAKTITLTSNLANAHEELEPISIVNYDQIAVYRSTSETGTYTKITNPHYNIAFDHPIGTFIEDTTGSTANFYKFVYRDSHSAEISRLADSPIIQGEPSDHYTSIYEVLSEAGLRDAQYLNWKIVEDYRLEAENLVNGYIKDKYVLPLSEVPELIVRVTTLLAACYLLSKEYGSTVPKGEEKGKSKCEEAMKILEGIASGKIKLVGSTGATLPVASTDRIAGYPDDSAPEEEDRVFSVTDKF